MPFRGQNSTQSFPENSQSRNSQQDVLSDGSPWDGWPQASLGSGPNPSLGGLPAVWPSTHPSPRPHVHPPPACSPLCSAWVGSSCLGGRWTWCSRSEPGGLSSVEARGWSLGCGLGGVRAGGLPRLPLGPGSVEPSMATLSRGLHLPSRAVWCPGPSLGETVGRVSLWMSSSPISSVRLCSDSDQQLARPGGIRTLPGRYLRRCCCPLELLLPDRARPVSALLLPGRQEIHLEGLG